MKGHNPDGDGRGIRKYTDCPRDRPVFSRRRDRSSWKGPDWRWIFSEAHLAGVFVFCAGVAMVWFWIATSMQKQPENITKPELRNIINEGNL